MVESVVQVQEGETGGPVAGLRLIDTDVHNYPTSMDDLLPYLSQRWRSYVEQSGMGVPAASLYPKMYAAAARRDAWPPSGQAPGSDPAFAAAQLLDAWSIKQRGIGDHNDLRAGQAIGLL